VEEAAGQAHEAFTPHVLPQRRLAGAEDHEVGAELQVVDVVQPKETVLSAAVFVPEGQDDARELGVPAVQDPVRGEVHDPVVPERRGRRGGAARGEVERLEARAASRALSRA
jgi:hypothetical protein